MSKRKGRKAGDAGREERRRAQLAAMQGRAAAQPVPAARREHIQGVDVEHQEGKYEGLLFAIESGLVAAYEERDGLLVDDEAERALRVVIAHFEGDTSRRSGSPDVDALAERVEGNIERYFRRSPLLSRAEIVGCLQRVIRSIHTWRRPGDPRGYFTWIREFIHEAAHEFERDEEPQHAGLLWTPGQGQPQRRARPADVSRRPGGLWVPGDD